MLKSAIEKIETKGASLVKELANDLTRTSDKLWSEALTSRKPGKGRR
jgi:hypothetical protein